VNDKSRSWAKDRSVKFKQPIQTTNRYTPLDNMFTSNEGLCVLITKGTRSEPWRGIYARESGITGNSTLEAFGEESSRVTRCRRLSGHSHAAYLL